MSRTAPITHKVLPCLPQTQSAAQPPHVALLRQQEQAGQAAVGLGDVP